MKFAAVVATALTAFTVVEAQNLDWDAILKAQPKIADLKPPTVNRAAEATKIINSLKAKKPKTTKVKPGPTVRPQTGNRPGVKAAGEVPCSLQKAITEYLPKPNTPDAFLVDSTFSRYAAQTIFGGTPLGYSLSFSNKMSAITHSSYMGSIDMTQFDSRICKAFCDSRKGCQSFNIYIERAPTRLPGTSCSNPSAGVMYRCAIYKSKLDEKSATNTGEWRSDFLVVITGSNLYNKNNLVPSVEGYEEPLPLQGMIRIREIDGQSVQVPTDTPYFPGAYDATKCTDLCTQTNDKNAAAARAAGSTEYQKCKYVNAAALQPLLNRTTLGATLGTYCLMFSDTVVASFSTFQWETYGDSRYYLASSWAYAIDGTLTENGPSATTTATSTPTPIVIPTSAPGLFKLKLSGNPDHPMNGQFFTPSKTPMTAFSTYQDYSIQAINGTTDAPAVFKINANNTLVAMIDGAEWYAVSNSFKTTFDVVLRGPKFGGPIPQNLPCYRDTSTSTLVCSDTTYPRQVKATWINCEADKYALIFGMQGSNYGPLGGCFSWKYTIVPV